MTPKDYVAVGQSFELSHDVGTLFTVTNVKRVYDRTRGQIWYVTIMCLVPSKYGGWCPGDVSVQVSYNGTLSTPWRRIG